MNFVPPPEPSAGLLSDYMDKKQTARELQISPRTLVGWHALKCGPPRVKVGRKWLYRKAAVAEWLISNEQA